MESSETRPSEHRTATIAAGASLSDAVYLGGYRMAGLLLPADINSATSITFQVCATETGTFQNLYDDSGNEVTLTVAASRAVGIDAKAGMLAMWRYVKIRLGTAGVPVNAPVGGASITVALKA